MWRLAETHLSTQGPLTRVLSIQDKLTWSGRGGIEDKKDQSCATGQTGFGVAPSLPVIHLGRPGGTGVGVGWRMMFLQVRRGRVRGPAATSRGMVWRKPGSCHSGGGWQRADPLWLMSSGRSFPSLIFEIFCNTRTGVEFGVFFLPPSFLLCSLSFLSPLNLCVVPYSWYPTEKWRNNEYEFILNVKLCKTVSWASQSLFPPKTKTKTKNMLLVLILKVLHAHY